jgi:hypothetical protein
MFKSIVGAAFLLSCCVAGSSVQAAPPPRGPLDKTLYAEFTLNSTFVEFTVCGSLPQSEGCYDGGTMNPPFEQACAVLQGEPKTKGDVMTRDIYVLDKRTSPTAPALLYVFERQDTITQTFDTTTVTLVGTVNLGITGGSQAHCSMAADKKYVFVGTDANPNAIRVSKSDNSTLSFGISNQGGVLNINADDRGYIALDFSGGYLITYQGFTVIDGGGNYDLVGVDNGVLFN